MSCRIASGFSRPGSCRPSDGEDQDRTGDRDTEVHEDPGQRDDDVTALVVTIVARIDRHRLGPAEDRCADERQERRQQHRHERIDVLERIPGEAAKRIGGEIALLHGRVPVGVLVGDHGEQQHGRDEEELVEPLQRCWGRRNT
jgi:hypothetical protein